MKIEQLQEDFVNTLLSMGFSEKEALEVSSTFFIAWVKSLNGEEPDPGMYEEAIQQFLARFKHSS